MLAFDQLLVECEEALVLFLVRLSRGVLHFQQDQCGQQYLRSFDL